MRQADSTIRGYLYQFNKSILEILNLTDGNSLVLEGIIEDIDILSPASTTTIQCKYHEDKKYTISSVAVPIIEMLCNYCETSYVGKDIHYILYAFFADNVDCIEVSDFCGFLNTTQDKEILTKYFHRIFTIPDATILKISNKAKKTAYQNEYIKKAYDRITVLVPKDKKVIIQTAAKQKGMSTNEFINDLIGKALKNDPGGCGISDTSDSTD